MFLRKRADNANTTVLPPNPVALTASGDFDGNDGKWSSFYINIGDDGTGRGQNFKVLPSTSSPITLVPQQANWCNEDCAGKRGVQIFNGQQPLGYDSSKSAAWSQAGLYTIPLPDWWSGNDSLPATWGSDNVGLGESSKTSNILAQQWVVESQVEEFYMGLFGLAAGSVGPGSAAQKAPFITNFYGSANLIPSRSYGYTAGASYRNNAKGVVGDLVLGGYDQSRAKISNGVSINMPNDRNNTLVVGVQSIIYAPDQDVQASSNSFTAGSSGFFATIDSTLPYLWLPDNICDQFAKYFQLDYDDKSNLYTVNASAHQNNKQQNATVSFKIGSGTTDSNQYASIVLPYDAFDLQIDVPLVDNVTNYFPLKKSPNGIFVLGRTFLQESYIVVDYERANFTVAPAFYNDPMPDPSLVSIYNKTYAPPIPSPTLIPSSGGGGLSGGAIAGIVVGIVVVILGAALGFFFWWKRRRNDQVPPYTEKPSEIDTMVAGTEVKHRRVSELDSEPPGSPKPSTVGGYYGDRDQKDIVPFPPINEMESPPAELYSPPPPRSATPQSEAGGSDYFIVGNRVRRRGATRESSQNNTPGTPAAIAELPGDDGKFQVGGMHFDPVATPKGSPVHSRGPSDSSLQTNIDEVMKRPDPSPSRKRDEGTDAKAEAKSTDNLDKPKEKEEGKAETGPEAPPQRRPSQHTRGLSDDTIQSDSTAVSQPTPEELEQWAMGGIDEPRRPLSQ